MSLQQFSLIQVAREQGKFTVQGTGEQLRSWLFVDDASEGIRRVAERGALGEMYNLGTGFELNGENCFFSHRASFLMPTPRTLPEACFIN